MRCCGVLGRAAGARDSLRTVGVDTSACEAARVRAGASAALCGAVRDLADARLAIVICERAPPGAPQLLMCLLRRYSRLAVRQQTSGRNRSFRDGSARDDCV